MSVETKTVLTNKNDMDGVINAWRNDGWTLANAVEQPRNKWLLVFERTVAERPVTYVYGTAKAKNMPPMEKNNNTAAGCLGLLVLLGAIYLCTRSGAGSPPQAVPTSTPRERATVTVREPTRTATHQGATAVAEGAVTSIAALPTAIPTRTPTRRPTQASTIIVTGPANLRACPGTDCAIVGSAAAGETFVLQGTQEGWVEVRTSDNRIAFIADFLVSTGPATRANPTATRTPVRAGAQSSFFSAQDREDAGHIRDFLAFGAGGRNIEYVVVVDGRPNGGTRSAQVGYFSTESTENGIVEEMFDILDEVYGASIQYNIDLDEVALLVGDAFGNAVAMVAIDMDDLVAFKRGSLTRSQFLGRMQIVNF